MDSKQLMQYGAKARLSELETEKAELLKLLGNGPTAVKVETTKSGRKPLSAQARKQLSAKLKAYWAQRKADEGPRVGKKK